MSLNNDIDLHTQTHPHTHTHAHTRPHTDTQSMYLGKTHFRWPVALKKLKIENSQQKKSCNTATQTFVFHSENPCFFYILHFPLHRETKLSSFCRMPFTLPDCVPRQVCVRTGWDTPEVTQWLNNWILHVTYSVINKQLIQLF